MMSSSSQVKAQLLGKFRVEVGGRIIGRLRTRKAELLLAYLLRYPQLHSREHITRLFWKGMPGDCAKNNLRVTLRCIRQQLEPPGIPAGSILQSGRQWVGLKTEQVETDIHYFEELCYKSELVKHPSEKKRLLETACTIYGGDFLTGCDEPWVLAERERLRKLYERAKLALVPEPPTDLRPPHSTQRSDVQVGLRIVLGIESLSPIKRFRVWIRSIVSTHQGQFIEWSDTDALILFNSIENFFKALAILTENLPQCHFAIDIGEVRYRQGRYEGIPLVKVGQLLQAGFPSQILCTERSALLIPQTQSSFPYQICPLGFYRLSEQTEMEAIHQINLSGNERTFPPLRALSPLKKWLISVPTLFVGREAEMTQLQTLLGSREGSLITLVGPPGVGKSRVAIEIAWKMEPHFGEACWRVSLQESHDSPAEQLARILNWEWRGIEHFTQSLTHLLGQQPALLIVDTNRPIDPAQLATLDLLRHRLPRLHCLVVASQPLDLACEIVFPIEPLPIPLDPSQSIEDLLRYPSVQLFCERARLVSPNFTLNQDNARDIAAICRHLEGLPLAIELVASRLHHFSPSNLSQQVSQSLDWQRRRPIGTLGLSLYASILAASQNLKANLRQFLAQLSVFKGDFTLADVHNVFQNPQAEKALEELVRSSLICRDGAQYRLLQPIRQFAWSHLVSESEQNNLLAKHFEHYLNLAISHASRIENWANLKNFCTNIEQALDWGLLNAPDKALTFAAALLPFWEGSGSYTRSYRLLCQFVERCKEPNQLSEAARIAIRLAVRQRDLNTAEHLLSSSLPQLNQITDLTSKARLQLSIGFYYWMIADYKNARSFLRQALYRMKRLDLTLDIGEVLNHLGIIDWWEGNLEKAVSTFESALKALPFESAPLLHMHLLGNLAAVHYQRNDFVNAEHYYSETLNLAQNLGQKRTLATTLTNWSVLLLSQNQLARARQMCSQAYQIWLELNEGVGEAAALNNLAEIEMREKEDDSARILYLRSLEKVVHYRLLWYLPPVLQNLSELAERKDDLLQAMEWQAVRLYVSIAYGLESQIRPSMESLAHLMLKAEVTTRNAQSRHFLEMLSNIISVSHIAQVEAQMNNGTWASCLNLDKQTRELLVEQLRPIADTILAQLTLHLPDFTTYSTTPNSLHPISL